VIKQPNTDMANGRLYSLAPARLALTGPPSVATTRLAPRLVSLPDPLMPLEEGVLI